MNDSIILIDDLLDSLLELYLRRAEICDVDYFYDKEYEDLIKFLDELIEKIPKG